MVYKNISLSNMPKVAEELFELQKSFSVICFIGNLGAGKTTLIKLLALKSGIQDTVQSPTFGYVNTYDNHVHHFDCYRFESPIQALDMGFEEYFDGHYKVWIEWPEVIRELIPEPYLWVEIKTNGENRDIEILKCQ